MRFAASRRVYGFVPIGAFVIVILPLSVSAQERCVFFCAPTISIEPTVTFENLLSRGRVKTVDGSRVEDARRESAFEMVFSIGIPTTISRVGFTIETAFELSGETDVHPFTGVTATQLGTSIRDNGIANEFELNLGVLEAEQTGGWMEVSFDIVDKISPGARPGATSVYTHKLKFELGTVVLLFNKLPPENWLRNVELEVSLDYVATGIPQAGDDFGHGEASGFSAVYAEDAPIFCREVGSA